LTEIERSGRRPTMRNCARERRTSSFQINYVLTLSAIRMKNFDPDPLLDVLGAVDVDLPAIL
jgi:hypothetical protein